MPDPNDPTSYFLTPDPAEENVAADDSFVAGARQAIAKVPEYLQGAIKRDQRAQMEQQVKVSTDEKGFAHLSMPADLANAYMEDIRISQQIQAMYDMQLAQKEAQLKRSRSIPGVIATIAGSLAANDRSPIVRGLGQTALAYNPTPQAIEQDIAGIQRGRQQARGQSTDIMTRLYQLSNSSEKSLATRAQNDNKLVADYLKSVRAAIKDGGGKPIPYEAFVDGAVAQGIPAERAARLYATHAAEAEAIGGAKTAHEARVDARLDKTIKSRKELETIKKDARISAERVLIPLREAAATRIAAARATISQRAEMAADRREFTAFEKAQPKVSGVVEMKDAVNTLRQLILENPDAVGVIEGRKPEWLLTKQEAKVRAEFFTVLDAVRVSINAQSRFWNPQEFRALSPKLTEASKTERANLGILDALDDFANRQARSIVRTNPYVAWDKVPDVWGSHAEGIFSGTEGGAVSPTQKSVDAKRPSPATAKAAPGATPPPDDFARWLERQKKK